MPSATQTLYLAELRRVWASNTDSAHDLAHIRRVWSTCQTIAATENADLEILLPAAIFHDIINLEKSAPNRTEASKLSADYAQKFLRTSRYPHAKIPAVHHAIHAHSFSANVACETNEAKILQDADRLDALGAIGIARCFAVSGQLNRALFHPTDPMAQNRPLDERTYALDHFQTKLFKIAKTLHTAKAREIAAQRSAYMQNFCDTLTKETQ